MKVERLTDIFLNRRAFTLFSFASVLLAGGQSYSAELPYTPSPEDLFGKSVLLSTDTCHAKMEYHPSETYDIDAYISSLEVKNLGNGKFFFDIQLENADKLKYFIISAYQEGSDYPPIENLATNPSKKEIDESAVLYFYQQQKKGQTYIHPVLFKSRYIAKDGEKPAREEQIFLPHTVKNKNQEMVEGKGTAFTGMIASFGGKGMLRGKKDTDAKILLEEGHYQLTLEVEKEIYPSHYFIVSVPKMSMQPSKRGLRSPIITPSFSVRGACAVKG